ncbi:MAG: molybdenum cofactor guanylyltransferase [Deltaproteobacteria bacterium]|nr:molybdenum cofactor guanylyltransferase [Deltaproteobacteria bacterium]
MSSSARRTAACGETAGAILAGGRSRRMGRAKAFIELGGRPLIMRVIEVLRELFPEVFIVSTDAAPFAGLGLPVIPDLYAHGGPLAGAHAALSATERSQVLVVGCDMPFLSPAMLAHLAGRAEGRGAAVPRGPDGLHPLHAVYSKHALDPIGAALSGGVLKFSDALSSLDVAEIGEDELRRFDPDLRSLFNVNRPEDLARAEMMIAADRTPASPAG